MKRLDSLKKSLLETFGKNAAVPGNDRKFLDVKRVPTGILELDIALGGGIPVGRVTTIWGPKSSGKSSLCEKILAAYQQRCRDCWEDAGLCTCEGDLEDVESRLAAGVWVDVEGTFTVTHAEDMGIETDRVLVVTPSYGEEAVDMIQASLESGQCDLLVIDSIASMSPKKEVERFLSEAKRQIGEQAALVTQFLRKLQMVLNELRKKNGEAPTVLLINQQRVKINTMTGIPGKMKPGGESQGFAASVEIQLISNKIKFEKDAKQNVTAVSYGESFFKIEKSKVATPGLSGRYRLWLAPDKNHEIGETDEIEKVVKIGIQEGIIEKTTSKLIYQEQNYKTQTSLRECMKADPTLLASIRGEILNRLIPRYEEAKRVLESANKEETRNPFQVNNNDGAEEEKESEE